VSIYVRVDPKVRPHVATAGRLLALDHPLHDVPCQCCGDPLGDAPVSLVLIGRDRHDPGWTASAVAVHDDCATPPEGAS